MQLTPRYLVNNRTNIVVDMTGFVTEYRPVYSKQLTVYKGIDNDLEFRILNADQKPIDLANYVLKFLAFDENKNLVIEHQGTNNSTIKGLSTVKITENDLLNLKQQYLSYVIYLQDLNTNTNVLTYTEAHFTNNGTIFVNGSTLPGPRQSYTVGSFTQITENTPYWVSESLFAEPALNGNSALHTAAIYTDSYVGDVVVQATLDNQVVGTTSWADIDTIAFTGTETEPTPVNFNGVFSYIRFVAKSNPANKITKILVRN